MYKALFARDHACPRMFHGVPGGLPGEPIKV